MNAVIIRAGLLGAVVATAPLTAPALAFVREGMAPMCPIGTVDTGFDNVVNGVAVINVNNGCSAAPATSPDTEQYPDLLLGYAQQSVMLNPAVPGYIPVVGWTGQSNVIQTSPYAYLAGAGHPWNIAGADYPVGPRPSFYTAGQLADPATATLPSGCSYGQDGQSNNLVTCTSAAVNPVLSGFDYTLHGGVGLKLQATGTCTITDSKFAMLDRSLANPATGNYASVVVWGCNSGFHFLYDRFAGRSNMKGWLGLNAQVSAWVNVASVGSPTSPPFAPADFEYDAFDQTPSRPVAFSSTSCYWAQTFKYDLFNGMNVFWAGDHGDAPALGGCYATPSPPAGFGYTYSVLGNTFIAGGPNGGGYMTALILPDIGESNEAMMFGAVDVEQNVLVTNLYRLAGGAWDHVSAVGTTMTIGDTSAWPVSQQLQQGLYFYSDASNGGVAINQGTTNGTLNNNTGGSVGRYVIDANGVVAGTIGNNVEFVTSGGADFFGYVTNTAFPNALYVTQMVSGSISPGTDELFIKSGMTDVGAIWFGQYTYPGTSVSAFGTATAPVAATTPNAAFTAYSAGGSGTDTFYVRSLGSGAIDFGDTFTVTGTGQTGVLSASNGGSVIYGGGAGFLQLNQTLYPNAGTTPPNAFTNKKIVGIGNGGAGSLINLAGQPYGGSIVVANNLGDDTGSYAHNCMPMSAANPMFAGNPVMNGNASLLWAKGSGAWTPTITHHVLNVTGATFSAGTPDTLTLTVSTPTLMAGGAVLNLSNPNGASGWGADWSGTWFIPYGGTSGNPTAPATVSTITVEGSFAATGSGAWSSAPYPQLDWYDGTMACPAGGAVP